MIHRHVRRYSLLDAGPLTRLFRNPEIFKACGDDFSDIRKLGYFIENQLRCEQVFIMGIDPRYEAFVFVPGHSTTCFDVHFCVNPDHRGKEAIKHLVQSAKYVFENSPCRSLIGFIRANNREAAMLATYVGMKKIGRTDKTMCFNGEMVDEIIFQCTVDDYNNKYRDIYGEV